jgi:AAA family ATP:ADP antiporter
MALHADDRAPGGEAGITFVSVAYFFFVICSYYVIKPIRGSLALELGSDNIPVLNILSMVSLVVANAVYSWIVGKYKRDIFIPFITRFFVVCLAAFWLIFTFLIPINEQKTTVTVTVAAEEPGISQPLAESVESDNQSATSPAIPTEPMDILYSYVKTVMIGTYYLWVNFFALMAVSMFWSFMNDVFTVSQGRRLYAIIGYGGLVGGLVGSALTSLLVQQVGTSNLFILAIVLLYPSIWCMQYIHKNHYRPEGIVDVDNKPVTPAHPPRPWDGFLSVCKNPILICMALEMFLYTFSSTMFFQQLNRLIEAEIGSDVNSKTAFIAGMYGRINIVSLFSQFFVTRLMMMLPNPVYGLLILNLIQVVGTFFTMFTPSLVVASWVVIIRYAIDYSTGRALRELVYIPLDREAKYQGKGFIDTVVFRVGDGLSSIILIGGLSFYSYGTWIDYSIQLAMLVQFYVIIKTAGLYGQRLKTAETQVTAPAPAS